MNAMNMPGFIAEASLYKTSGHYRLTTRSAGRADVHLGLAQFALPVPLPNGGGQLCLPGCGPCLPDSDSPTGLFEVVHTTQLRGCK